MSAAAKLFFLAGLFPRPRRLFRRHTLPWQIGRFGGKICVVYPVGAEGAAVELLPEGAPRMSAFCVLKSTAGTWYNYQTKAQYDEERRINT